MTEIVTLRRTPPIRLTPREREVLFLLCEGLPNKLIARRLDIAVATVKIHVSNILQELGVASRLQAVIAIRHYGLTPEGEARPADGPADFADEPLQPRHVCNDERAAGALNQSLLHHG